MARLVGALPGQRHPKLPVGLGEVAQAARRALEAVDLLVHLAMRELHLVEGMIGRGVDHLDPAVLHVEPGVARGALGEQRRVERSRATG